MSDLFWMRDEQMARLRPFFPRSHGKPRVDDRRVLSGIILKPPQWLAMERRAKGRWSAPDTVQSLEAVERHDRVPRGPEGRVLQNKSPGGRSNGYKLVDEVVSRKWWKFEGGVIAG